MTLTEMQVILWVLRR